jgi:hypothetical protein
MEEILKINSMDDYNKLFGLETRHPLVSVVDLSQATRWPTQAVFNYGIYALFLKDTKCGDIRYGRQLYDYQDGTIVSFGPGQIAGINMPSGVRPAAHGLLFHPDLIRGTALGQEIRNYTFFSYEANEALHLSEEERQTIMDCLNKIQAELEHAIDKHSRRLITANIGVLLDYCLRFYDRQFVTRNQQNNDIIVRFERLLDEYFDGPMPSRLTLGQILRGQGLSLPELFRRHDSQTNREDRLGIHSNQGHRTSQGKSTFLGQNDERNRLRPGLPIPPAFKPDVQTGGWMHTQRISGPELSFNTPHQAFLPMIPPLNPLFHNHHVNPNGLLPDHFRIKN